MKLMAKFKEALQSFPCVAILRGLEPTNALEIGQALLDAGFVLIEVPLNSPEPLRSIEILSDAFGGQALIGAGTVLNAGAVKNVHDAGGRFIVAPNFNAAVVAQTKSLGAISVPGVQTPSEAFAAIDSGADALKIFPGEAVTPNVFKAMKAVLPPAMPTLICGGINSGNMESYLNVGATGFGVGSSLFKASDDAVSVSKKAFALKQTILSIRAGML